MKKKKHTSQSNLKKIYSVILSEGSRILLEHISIIHEHLYKSRNCHVLCMKCWCLVSCPRLQVDGAEGNLDGAEPVPLYTGVNSVPSLPLILTEFRQTGQHSNDSGNDP